MKITIANTAKIAIAGTAIAGAYVIGNKQAQTKYTENNDSIKTVLVNKNNALSQQLQEKDSQIKNLEKDVFELVKENSEYEFDKQLDSMKTNKNLDLDFYGRILTNAEFLDRTKGGSKHRKTVISRMTPETVENIHDGFSGQRTASAIIANYYKHNPVK